MFGSRNAYLKAAALGLAVALPATGAMVLAPAPASASEQIADGSKARINNSSKLGMLSERIVSAACRAGAGIDRAGALQELEDARLKVESILNGLENGDTALGIPGAELRSRNIKAIRAARAEWEGVLAAVGTVTQSADAATTDTLVSAARRFEDAADLLSSEIAAHYSNPNELLFIDAIAIGMAARQRMLVQKISAETCLMASGNDQAEDLSTTTSLFERTLIALRDGYPDAGIRQPPNDAVMNKITASWDKWQKGRSMIEPLLSGAAVDPASVADVAATSHEMEKAMNDLVVLYILSTPGRDDAIRGVLKEMAETELKNWVAEPAVIDAVKAQNQTHAALTQDAVDSLDKQWRAEAKDGGGSLVDDLMSRPLSRELRTRQVATAGFINEIFIMDNKGLNVAQSAVTSDYWQGDEAKWIETYGNGSGAVHISDVEFDESTGVFQSQISLPVRDPETGSLIGAVTFGVNVQSLL